MIMTIRQQDETDIISSTRFSKRFKYIVGLVILLGMVTVGSIGLSFVVGSSPPSWMPPFVVEVLFDIRLFVAPLAKGVSSFISGDFTDDRVYFDTTGERITFENDSLTIVGTLYKPDQETPAPAILLLHGSTPEGSRMGLYRILASGLAQRGYVVLAIDQRAYNESEDPADISQVASFDFVADVQEAIVWLLDRDEVNPDAINIIGHSFGADVAISTGIIDEHIQTIIGIGPGRNFYERVTTEIDYFRRREMRYMNLSSTISEELLMGYKAQLVIDNHIEYFSEDGHKPLLLIDGELESEADLITLADVVEQMSDDVTYITLDNSDHYVNVANIRNIVFYDEKAINNLFNIIDDWLINQNAINNDEQD